MTKHTNNSARRESTAVNIMLGSLFICAIMLACVAAEALADLAIGL